MGSIAAVAFQKYKWLRTIASVFMALLYTWPEGFGASSNAMSIAFRQLLCVLPNLKACRAVVIHVLRYQSPQFRSMADKTASMATAPLADAQRAGRACWLLPRMTPSGAASA